MNKSSIPSTVLHTPVSGEEGPGLHFEGFPDERKVNILQLKHTIDILLYINSRGSVREVDVRNDVTRNFEMSSKRLNMLREMGLADCMYPDSNVKGHKARKWWLTGKGRTMAKLLIVMNRGIAGELDLEDPVIENFCDEVLLPDETSEKR